MDPSSVIWKDVWSEILNETWLDDLEGLLVGYWDGEVLGQSNRVLVGRLAKERGLVHHTGPGSGNEWVTCLMGLVDDRVLRGVETKVVGSCEPRHMY